MQLKNNFKTSHLWKVVKIMKLISMTDFVINKRKELLRHSEYKNDLENYANIIYNYAQFLKQPLKLEMFFPCDDGGNILEEPIFHEPNNENEIGNYQILIDEYYEAKEKVLFEGIEFRKNAGVNFLTIKEDTFDFFDFNIKFKNLTVEFLVQYNLQLTESAIKQIGL